ARDAERDQSYFLFATTRQQLDILRFPLGERTKAETRELARKFGLSVADKHDSQDICFVPSGRYTEVIERLRPGAAEPGEIVDLDGRVLGRHNGIIHFTVGQRRGIGIAAGRPLYVVRLDAERRRVVVGPREALTTRKILLRDVNWIGDGDLETALAGREVFVKVRSTRAPQPAWLADGPDGVVVDLLEGEDGVSPGQACVFYAAAGGQARVLGGGFIKRTVSADAQVSEPRPELIAARACLEAGALPHVEVLAVMDARHLGVRDGAFDVVVAQDVITAVPDPEATLDEFARVVKPGGEIVLVNHIGAEAGLRRAFEHSF